MAGSEVFFLELGTPKLDGLEDHFLEFNDIQWP